MAKPANGSIASDFKKSFLFITKQADLGLLIQQFNVDVKLNFFTNQYSACFVCCVPGEAEILAVEFTCKRKSSLFISSWIGH